ncbi:NAD(P)/FAD-dependent oxidoreductase [Halostella pelagica]|uniref:NAD(P)/FAD-dependent oxidoreductase n=1 Tax=Halostella pelagica TaxID=2583824 RepID=UPI001080E3B6|nr:NAD(P)/FAD-dependent oxidoreductase [Halostella pelagica]
MIGIVGGGVAGLAAAYRLQERGHDVHVFEANEEMGGLAAVYETAGDPIEKFYHHLSGAEETIVDLAEELGLSDRVEWRYKTDAYYVDGVVHPLEKLWEIAAYPHLSLYDKFRLGMLTMEVDCTTFPPSTDSYDDIEAYEDVPVEQFLREHTTDQVYERFWLPLLDAKFGSRKEDVSAAWLLGRVKFRGERDLLRGEQLGYFRGSFAVLIDALLDAVGRENVTTGARVTGVDTTGGTVRALTAETENGSATYEVDSVVVAAMPNVLEDLTGYACDIDFQGTVCSVWSMDRSLSDAYWLNIADEAPFGVLIEHTNFVPPERYGGEHLYYTASYVQDPAEELWQLSNAEVEDAWRDGIADLFPDFSRDDVNWVRTARKPRTAPVYERGYLDMVIPYDLAGEVADDLYYAGMASEAQYPERSLNGGIVAGFEAADRIAEKGTRRERPPQR